MTDSRTRLAPRLAVALALLSLPPTVAAPPAATGGGRLAWMFADDLDLVGDLWADLPFPLGERADAYFAVEARTTIAGASTGYSFDVRDLIYELELGWRAPLRVGSRWIVTALAAQRGRERVDADGQGFVRFVGAGIETEGIRRPPRAAPARVEARVVAGPVFDRREVEADVALRGTLRWRVAPRSRGIAGRFGLEARVDALLEGLALDADVEAGPQLEFPAGDTARASFFVRYLHAHHPLGVGSSGVLAGFEYDGVTTGRSADVTGPSVDGLVGTGGGDDGRLAGQLRLRLLSPESRRRLRAALLVDANILTADDTGDLYYFWRVGLERVLGRAVVGAHVYHRSNHELAEPNDRVTSLNVLELALESRDWRRTGARRPASAWGRLEGAAAAGYLLDSTFGENQCWHVRADARWSLAVGGRVEPYLRAELEAGDADRHTWAAGLAPGERLDLELQLRRDDQYASADRDAWLLLARYGF